MSSKQQIAELKTYKAIYDDADKQLDEKVMFGDDCIACLNTKENALENIFKIINQL